MIERRVSSSIAAARKTANRTMPFQYGTGSVVVVEGDERTSETSAATVEMTTATAPHRRPRFHVTSPIGMRYRRDRESCGPVR